MIFVYLILGMMCITLTHGAVKAIKEKKMGDLLQALLAFPFCFGFFIGVISGGSALHHAETEYELYQAGHYYLMSHGDWTEVSRARYLFVLVSEIIGFSTFGLSFFLACFRKCKSA